MFYLLSARRPGSLCVSGLLLCSYRYRLVKIFRYDYKHIGTKTVPLNDDAYLENWPNLRRFAPSFYKLLFIHLGAKRPKFWNHQKLQKTIWGSKKILKRGYIQLSFWMALSFWNPSLRRSARKSTDAETGPTWLRPYLCTVCQIVIFSSREP